MNCERLGSFAGICNVTGYLAFFGIKRHGGEGGPRWGGRSKLARYKIQI